MIDEEIIEEINNLSQKQVAHLNIRCNNKLYYANTGGRISQDNLNQAIELAEHINNMTQEYIDTNINPSLNEENKLSQRPC